MIIVELQDCHDESTGDRLFIEVDGQLSTYMGDHLVKTDTVCILRLRPAKI